MFNFLLSLLLLLTTPCLAQVSVTQDVLPDTKSTDSTASLNNQLRMNQNAINSIGGYFNNNGALGVANGGTGAVTLTGILQGNGQNPITGIALTGNTTDFLNGTGAFSPLVHGIQLFTASGTFTVPAGVTKVYLTMIGAGGGGGSDGAGDGNAMGGGGSGAYLLQFPFTVTPLANLTVTIGAGGTAAANANGNDGGTTSFDSISVLGGSGGRGITGGGARDGGAGGVGTIGATSVTTIGSSSFSGIFAGANGFKGDIASQYGGTGAGSPFGPSVGNSGRNTTGNSGTANTGVGGGGCWTNSAACLGGAGASGFVLVIY